MNFFLALLIVFCLALLLFQLIGKLLSTQPYQGPKSDHFNGRRFQNPSGTNAKGFDEVIKYIGKRKPDKWPNDLDQSVRTTPLPVPIPAEIQYTFINHSTFLIQHQGMNILTDPIWSMRCSPVQFAGPKRQRPPGLPFEQLPAIDIVLITHNHYDHLDKNTIFLLNKKQKQPTYVVPLGVAQIMKKWDCREVIEIDWNESTQLGQIEITALPANHFSSRGTYDRNTSLWCGYLVTSATKKFYYLGDTGYSDIFKQTAKHFGPFDLCFIPIGAYLPEWFMSPIHISPAQAAQVHLDLGSKKSVAMHFGTFKLADDNPTRAKSELLKALAENNLNEELFHIPREGDCYQLN